MTRLCLPVLCLAMASATIAAAAEDPGRIAAVIGEAAYPGLPALPGCTASAQAMAAAFTKLGFTVLHADNASNGAMGGQLSSLDTALRTAPAPGKIVAVYLCGYARALSGRGYLLPVDARIDRPTDLLAQGVLPQTFLRVASGDGAASGLLLMDLFDVPGQPSGFDAPSRDPAYPGYGIAAARHASPGAGVTPLAAAAAAALAPGADAGAVVEAVRAKLGASVLGLAAPTAASPLAPPPAPPPPDPATVEGRRAVQQCLTRLGYYGGPADGVFGPDSKAAIRRLQHELGDPMTGTPTPPEITALQARAR